MAKQPKTTRERMIQEMVVKMSNSNGLRFEITENHKE